MKKTSKKLFALLLAFTLVFSLTACGNKQDTKTATDDTVATDDTAATDDDATATDADDAAATPTEVAATPTTVPDKYEAFDFGGRTIKVGIWWDYYYTSKDTAITDNPGVSNTETAQMQLDNVRRIEEKYNCKIEYVNYGWGGIINSINTSIAAGTPECDLYITDLQFGIPAVFNGLAQEVSSFANPNSDLLNDQQILQPLKSETMDGIYLFNEQGINQTGIFLGYNSTMIQDMGLEDPQALYNKGEWTWEKFAEYAKAGTKDSDGDGTNDVYGYGGAWTTLVQGLSLNNGGSIAGGTTEGLSSTPVKETFEFIDRLYNIDQSARPWDQSNWDANLNAWNDGKVMFFTAQAWSLKAQIDAAAANGTEIPFEFHVVPFPNGPSGDGTSYSPYLGNWYMIPVGVQEPAKVLQIFEEFMNWHGGDTEYRDDMTWFESCFLTQEDMDLALMVGQNLKFDPWGNLQPYFDLGSTVFMPVAVDKSATVAQAIETAKPMLQGALDNFVYKNK